MWAMKNITITLDAETASWVRVKAAEQNKSVSRFIGELLQQQMKERLDYQRAMESFLSKPAYQLGEPGEPLPKREELYDRPRIR
jgi:predicted CopG family antitoxin